MSLYELLSTVAGLNRIQQDNKKAPKVSDEEWENAMDVITHLAQFDSSINLG